MNALSRLLLLSLFAGAFVPGHAGDFARQVPADSILYLEIKDFPAYQKKIVEYPAIQSLKDFEWKKLILQFYQIGLENSENNPFEGEPPSAEALEALLTESTNKWQEVKSHLNGDIAFSVGNFQNVISVFAANAKARKTLALNDTVLVEEDLTEAEMKIIEERMAEEARLDSLEAASILGQFRIWMDVKNGGQLEAKLDKWLRDFSENDPDAENPVLLISTEWEDTTLYTLGSKKTSEASSINWAIKDGVWVITFTPESLKQSIEELTNPSRDVLANQKVYQESIRFVGPSDYLIYLAAAPLNTLLKEALATMPVQGNQALPQTDKIIDWLALDAFLPYVLGSKLVKEGARTRGRFGFTRETALSRIFFAPEIETAEIPGFLHRDINHFASFHWHLGNGWSRLETELTSLIPQAAAGMGLARMLASGQLGFDIKLQFLDHLDGGMIFMQTLDPQVIDEILTAAREEDLATMMKVQMEHPTGGQNYLLGLKMKNQAAIAEAMSRLLARFHPAGVPEPTLYEGKEIFYPIPETIQGGKFQQFLSYTYLDGYLLLALGDDTMIKNSIVASKNPDLQLVNSPKFTSLREKVLSAPVAIEYANGQQQKDAVKMMQSSMRMLQAGNADLELPDLMPLAELIDQSISTSVRRGLIYEVEGLIELTPAE